MNDQEIFEKALRGIIKQGRPGIGKSPEGWDACMFVSGEEGSELRCAVGFTLSDEQARAIRNRCGSVSVLDDMFKELSMQFEMPTNRGLILDIQDAHDDLVIKDVGEPLIEVPDDFIARFIVKMRDVAARHDLTFPADI